MMLGYERKIWEIVGGIKTGYSGKAHLISGNSHWRKQTLVRHLYFKESPHSSAAIKKVKCSCSNQNPEEQREIPVRGRMREIRFIGEKETLGVPHF